MRKQGINYMCLINIQVCANGWQILMGINLDGILLCLYICLNFKLLVILFNFISWKYFKKWGILRFFPLGLLGCSANSWETINSFYHWLFTAISHYLSQFVIICLFVYLLIFSPFKLNRPFISSIFFPILLNKF